MKEKTKKILKGLGLGLGSIAILALGVGIGACSVKNGSAQPVTTTPIRKGLNQRPKKAVLPDVEYIIDIGKEVPFVDNLPNQTQFNVSGIIKIEVDGVMSQSAFTNFYYSFNNDNYFIFDNLTYLTYNDLHLSIGNDNQHKVRVSGNYDDWDGWFDSASYCSISFDETPDLGVHTALFESFLSNPSSDTPEPEPEPTPLPETKEKIVLNASYDFRRWFGNVDPTTGLIQYSLGSGVSLVNIRVGGLEWINLGNNRLYNCIEFSLQPLQSANAFLVSDNLAKSASSLYGDNLNQFAMLSNVYYSYQSGYDGAYSVLTDTALPSVDYRDKVYSFPLVTAQLDGTNNNINAIDVRNCVIPSIYRTFGVVEDSEIVFSTNGYSSVTLRQLLGMDFSSVVNYSDGTASAFSLLTQAFGSVAGLLAVQVLPNITLGLLIFLPLIASVIVLIIKAVKK